MYLDDSMRDIVAASDEEVLARSTRAPELFEVLVDRYQDAFLRKAKSILHDPLLAEEVVQEAFTKIYIHADKFEVYDNASFKSWAYKILINTAITQYQKSKRERGRTAQLDPEFYEMLPDTTSRQFEKEELSDYVISVLSRIPNNLSEVLKLHFLEGRSHKEIAESQNASVGAIKTRVHRAKQAFRDMADKISPSV